MTAEEFKTRHAPDWVRLENLLTLLERGKPLHEVELSEFDRLYRLVCKHLALARLRIYGSEQIDYLNGLALRAHHRLYGSRTGYFRRILRFLTHDFPKLVRDRKVFVAVAVGLFLVPAVAIALAVRIDPDFIHYVMSPHDVRGLEEMYDPNGKYRTSERAAATDTMMFGFYIQNNISVAFRAFAGGILAGIGSIFIIAFNGVYLGAVSTHLIQNGMSTTFLSFVAGHSAVELIAILLSGAAGLNVGWAMLVPGRFSRVDALKNATRDSIGIVAGTAAMLVIAAFIEAYWSSSQLIPNPVKYAVGIVLWIAVPLYFVAAGRTRGS